MNRGEIVRFSSSRWHVPQVLPLPRNVSLKKILRPCAINFSASVVGLGIGLYLVREVVLAHHGRVEVKSQPGLGSEFTIELPRT